MSSETRSKLQALASAVAQEFGAAIGQATGTTPSLVVSRNPAESAWTVTIRVGTPLAGAITLGISRNDAAPLARAVLGGDRDPSDGDIVDSLQQLAGCAVDAVREQPVGAGVLFCVESPCAVALPPAAESQAYVISATPELSPMIEVWTVLDDAADAQQAPMASMGFGGSGRADRHVAGVPANLEVILDIDLPLSVRFGHTEMTLDALTRVGPGSVIDLGRSPDEPVDVLVNGRLVARAEVVVVGRNYGVRILEVVSAADRVRSFGNA